MAQWSEYLLCDYDRSADPCHLHTKLCMAMHACDPRTWGRGFVGHQHGLKW
ncbi:hypothetical protein I79_011949 [Cricetulus griseus]|uniref:Uncharacterized protein n=1 Tax=Cricetulus griseus TaxID=10029 RepID=G3HMI7_CRIGR|nr:hypothetical protein I79_011949 [Cricetulus griseus]